MTLLSEGSTDSDGGALVLTVTSVATSALLPLPFGSPADAAAFRARQALSLPHLSPLFPRRQACSCLYRYGGRQLTVLLLTVALLLVALETNWLCDEEDTGAAVSPQLASYSKPWHYLTLGLDLLTTPSTNLSFSA